MYYFNVFEENKKGDKMKKQNKKKIITELAASPMEHAPESVYELINKYGTYEIQPTSATDNQYPAIAQGFNKKQIKHDCRNPIDKPRSK